MSEPTDDDVNADLRMSFALGQPYPEWSDNDLRTAWRDGYAAACATRSTDADTLGVWDAVHAGQ